MKRNRLLNSHICISTNIYQQRDTRWSHSPKIQFQSTWDGDIYLEWEEERDIWISHLHSILKMFMSHKIDKEILVLSEYKMSKAEETNLNYPPR